MYSDTAIIAILECRVVTLGHVGSYDENIEILYTRNTLCARFLVIQLLLLVILFYFYVASMLCTYFLLRMLFCLCYIGTYFILVLYTVRKDVPLWWMDSEWNIRAGVHIVVAL